MDIKRIIKLAEKYKKLETKEQQDQFLTVHKKSGREAIELGMLVRKTNLGYSHFYMRELAWNKMVAEMKNIEKETTGTDLSQLRKLMDNYEELCSRGWQDRVSADEIKELEKYPPSESYMNYAHAIRELGLELEGNIKVPWRKNGPKRAE